MKKTILLLLAFSQITAFAQQDLSAKSLFNLGMRYLNGISKPYDPGKAMTLFRQSASGGNADAMNALGNIYIKGTGVPVNTDSAFVWLKASASAGNSKAMVNLGRMYKTGTGTSQDFSTAVYYYKKSAQLNNVDGINALAYMYYKGLGTDQNYDEAFNLFTQAAERGNTTAMYFIGLCFRNGYGTKIDADLSKYWLTKAASRQEVQAMHELSEEPLPENISAVSPRLENELTALKNYEEKFQAASSNNYEGFYEGYAIYYDWSGKYVHEIQPLKISLQKQGNSYRGTWQEGDIPSSPVSISVSNNIFTFDKGVYTRINHYSDRSPENWQFNQARLQLGFINDSILLSGYVQFYSLLRHEPGKPLRIVLKRNVTDENAGIKNLTIGLFPNPATSQANIRFTLEQSARVAIQVSQQNGSVVYTDAGKLLPPGTYDYPVQVGGYAAGSYTISVIVGGKIAASKILIKQ